MIELKGKWINISHSEIKGKKWPKPFLKLFPFAVFNRKGRTWSLPANDQNITDIGKLFDVDLVEMAEPLDIEQFKNRDFKTKPFDKQLEALAKCAGKEYFAYFMEPGTGKTKVTIDDMEMLFDEGKVQHILVVCPKSAMAVWKKELMKHSRYYPQVATWPQLPKLTKEPLAPVWFIVNPDAIVTQVNEMGKVLRKIGLYDQLCKSDIGYIVPYFDKSRLTEALKHFTVRLQSIMHSKEYAYPCCCDFLAECKSSAMVVDESTVIANTKSLRHKECVKLRGLSNYQRILTGDPIANTPVDLFGQFRFLNEGILRQKTIYSFMNRYCIRGGYMNKQIFGYQNTDELQRIMERVGYRCLVTDMVDMPKRNWLPPRIIEPSASTMQIYNDIVEKEIMTLFSNPDDLVSAALVITKLLKLQQVCGGTLIDDKGKAHIIGNEKAQDLKQMIADWGQQKILIWCHFREEINLLVDTLGSKYNVNTLTGEDSQDARGAIEDMFEKGDTEILILQDDTGHMALTLVAAQHAIFYSNHQRPMVRNQAERRNWRIGQRSPVFYHDALMGLYDSKIYKALRKKRQFNESITDRVSKSDIMEICYDTEEGS